MAVQYRCKNTKRSQTLRDSLLPLNGIDYLEVLDKDAPEGTIPQRTLLVRMLKPTPWGLTASNVQIEGGVRVTAIKVLWVLRASEASDTLVEAVCVRVTTKVYHHVAKLIINSDRIYSSFSHFLPDTAPRGWTPVGYSCAVSNAATTLAAHLQACSCDPTVLVCI